MTRRILVKGGSGAGKTTLAARLARQLGVPHIELDALHHGPNWTPAPAELLRERVLTALDGARGWVVDGNYDSALGTVVLDRAELIVWLDLPLPTKLWRLVRRTSARLVSGKELWNGNRENLRTALWGRQSLFVWAVQSHFRQRREWPSLFEGRRVVRLQSEDDVNAWCAHASELSMFNTSVSACAGAG